MSGSKSFLLFLSFMVVTSSLLVFGIYLQFNCINETERLIEVDILDVNYKHGNWKCHSITIIETNTSVMVFDNIESFPIGQNVRLLIRDSTHDGEYTLLEVIE